MVARPGLFGRLGGPARVMLVYAPPGSGKTVLLRSWISRADVAGRAAWVAAGRDEGGPPRFWASVLAALRLTGPGSALVQPVTAAPGLDGWAAVEQLLADLAPMQERVWLVVDDLHELDLEALRQLQLLVMRAPPGLRFVLAARRDVRLGLHRLRLEGEVAEIRGPDLRFTVAESGELLAAAGVQLSGQAVQMVHERTEGWAAGLRLAALSLAGHPNPEQFAAEFSGTERTVADYLLAEVLDRQDERVRRLLLRTSILERVNAELAEVLTGDQGAERVLQDLEAAGAFVMSLEPGRTWFRYHQMFADLLQLELRRTDPGEVTKLHHAAAEWFAGHGFGVEAVRHAQATRDWDMAAWLLADLWPGLYLDGRTTTVNELLAGFPAGQLVADAGLAALAAAGELAHGSLEAAERYLDLAGRRSESVPEARRGQLRLLLGVVSLMLAGQRGNLSGVAEKAQQLAAMAEDADTDPQYGRAPASQPGLGEDLRALALISIGSAGFWAAGQDAGRYLERSLALARRIGRPYLEFTGLAYQSAVDFYQSFERSAERATAAAELARRHGWSNEPAFGAACLVLGSSLLWQGQLDEAEPWIQRAESTLRAEIHPVPRLSTLALRGVLELARGRDTEALATFLAAEQLAKRVVAPLHTLPPTQAMTVHTLVRLGETERAERALAGLGQQDREHPEIRIATAALRLAQDNPDAALAEVASLPDCTTPVYSLTLKYVLEATAWDTLGDPAAADSALEHALDLAEPDGAVTPFLFYPVQGLLERHARHGTAHAALNADIVSLLAGRMPAPHARQQPLLEPLSDSEIRVLRYLPTNLTGPEIAGELYVSHNTVSTHTKHLYTKLGTHTRAETVARARALGLLAPSRPTRQARLVG